jgi:hypothetical protein
MKLYLPSTAQGTRLRHISILAKRNIAGTTVPNIKKRRVLTFSSPTRLPLQQINCNDRFLQERNRNSETHAKKHTEYKDHQRSSKIRRAIQRVT